MKIRRHYITLRRCYPYIREHTPLEVTLEELAAKLDCTHRNMVLLLKRMQEEGWMTWSPRRGRGNRSILTFQSNLESMLLQEAQEMVQKQDLHAALETMRQADISASVHGQFQLWLTGQFGFRSEVQGRKRTDILRFPLPQVIHSLDPERIHFSGESHMVNQLFDSLVRIDAQGVRILPHLAHAWEVDASRTKWTFYLRKGVFFHHGREMTASDVVYSLERLRRLAPRGLYSWAYRDIVAIEASHDWTVTIQLAKRNETFLAFLTTNRASIIPQDACEAGGGNFGLQPVGSGPFRLAGQEHGIWVLEAFPAYFQGRGFLDRVEVWTMAGNELQADPEGLQPFQIMHNVRMSGDAADSWQQVRQSGMTCKFLTVNERKEGPLASMELRAYVDAVLDRGRLIEQLSGDVIEAADSFWPAAERPARVADHASESRKPQPILHHLGEIKLRLATIPEYEADARLVQALCGEAGLTVEIDLIAAEQFKGEARMAADLLLFAVMLDEHRELRLIDLFLSMQQHASPEAQTMLSRYMLPLKEEQDAACRRKLFLELEEQLKLRYSLIFLYRKHLKTAYHPSVRGIAMDSLGWVRFRDIWFPS